MCAIPQLVSAPLNPYIGMCRGIGHGFEVLSP